MKKYIVIFDYIKFKVAIVNATSEEDAKRIATEFFNLTNPSESINYVEELDVNSTKEIIFYD